MIDEEKEAIQLENISKIKYNLERWQEVAQKGELEDYHLIDEDIEIMELAIKIIEKQQKEMFKLQAKVDRVKVARDNWKKTFYQAKEEIEKYKYLYQKALDNTIKADRENFEKDKIIDEMAKIFIKSDYCFEITDHLKCNECINKNIGKQCEKCIKEYFKKKVEDK